MPSAACGSPYDGSGCTSLAISSRRSPSSGVSFAATPSLWFDWIDFLQRSSGDGPSLLIRCTIAVVLVVVGARTGRPWLLAPALMVGTPVLAGNSVIALLAAIPRLVIAQRDPI